MRNLLTDKIREVIEENLQDKPILVWYDNEGTLIDAIQKAVPLDVEFVMYDGSYLKIRAKIEDSDSQFKKKWLIYIPEQELEPSWIRDYELLGSKVTLGLERLVVEKMGISSDAKLRDLLKGQRGVALSKYWDEIMVGKSAIHKEDLVKGLLAIVFGLGPGFSVNRAVLEYVSEPDHYSKELERYGLHPIFAELIATELGLKLNPVPRVEPDKLAVAILFSELTVNSGGIGEKEFQYLLPKQDKRRHWVEMCDDWQENERLREAFLQWSERIEMQYEVEKKITGFENLISVTSFKCVDNILVNELCARIQHTEKGLAQNAEMALQISQTRNKTVWARTEKTVVWRVIQSGIELYKLSLQASSELSNISKPTLDELILYYTKDDGWWNMDRAYLELASLSDKAAEAILSLFVRPATVSYVDWLNRSNTRFSDAVSASGKWSTGRAMDQQSFWDRVVGNSHGPSAIFFIDALRYDLCRILEKELVKNGYEVSIQNMLSSLPSVTEVGMLALLPSTKGKLTVGVSEGKMNVSLDGDRISGKAERIRWLSSILGDELKIFDLDEINKTSIDSLQTQIKDYTRIVIMDREIDRTGTFLPDVSIESFQRTLKSLSDSISKLHMAGISRVIVATDHGFILLPKGHKFESVSNVGTEQDFDKSRRYLIGKPPKLEEFVNLSLGAAGLSGDGYILFPYGLAIVGMQGEPGQFIHGGISLQENCIGVLLSSMKERVGKVTVEVIPPLLITTAVFLVELRPVAEAGKDVARRVFLEVLTAGEIIAKSDTLTVENEPRKARLVLKKIPDEVEIRVIDADSRESVVTPKRVKVQLSGYDEVL